MKAHRWLALLIVAFVWSDQAAIAQYGLYHFGRNKIQYDDFDWQILKTEHFDIYYYPEMQELAEYGASFAEEVYDELEHRFNTSLNHRVPMIFYASNLHFKQTNVTPGFIPDGVGGFFEFLKGRVVIPANGNIHQFKRVVRHEMVHVFTYAKVIRVLRDHRVPTDRFLPLWFTEGIAEYWSGPAEHQHEMVIRDALFSNMFVPLENMYRISGSYQMYKQGEAFFRFISETYGEEKILEMMENLWRDRDFRRVTEITLQEDFLVTADRWDKWMRKIYYPRLQEADAPSLIADGLSYRGFASKPVYYRYNDGTRKVIYTGNEGSYSNVFAVEVDTAFVPAGKAKVLIRGERDNRFEAFHLFESQMDVSEDGKLAFVTKSGARDVVHVFDLEADKMLATYEFDDLIAIYSPAWNPDGTGLAFMSIDQSGFADLYTYDTQTAALRKLTDDHYDVRDPAWSPDGRYIAFTSDRTAVGHHGYYNLFIYDLTDGHIEYVTYGQRKDFAPTWSPDGQHLMFTSAVPEHDGRWSAQDIWVADMSPPSGPQIASTALVDTKPVFQGRRTLHRLTKVTSATFDPQWTDDGNVIFASFEQFRFTVRQLDDVDALIAAPKNTERVDLTDTGERWAFERTEGEDLGTERVRYRRKYQLDIAQGALSQNPVLGTTGGAMVAFSDMLGDEFIYATVFNTGTAGNRDFLESFSAMVSRYHLNGRANFGYGIYRFGGLRYDITDPDAPSEFPLFTETIWGAQGMVSYPLSMFRRIELNTSLSWSDKNIPIRQIDRQALLLSNSISLTHDNALYSYNGPIQGRRSSFTLAYTTDVLNSNVSYYSLIGDVRNYWRIAPRVTFASWGQARMNFGRESRLYVAGGSWDLRGFGFFDVRGQKMWFTSHELRFPLVDFPGLILPFLQPFGIVNIKGALFFDAAHAWNDEYFREDYRNAEGGFDDAEARNNFSRDRNLFAGETLGSAGVGLRMNLFGGIVLRYDYGRRYRDGFERQDKVFRQFFFGYNF
ncbi:MAG: BamA/TamA family outer membrane protein [Bacteroidota bacterium]